MFLYYTTLPLLLVVLQVDSLSTVQRGFQFPDGSAPSGPAVDLSRQSVVVNGTITTGIVGIPGLPGLPNPVANIVGTGTGFISTTGTCFCVPTGRCVGNGTSGFPNDGSGQIDIRIVTSPLLTIPNTSTPAIVTPAVCQVPILDRCCSSGGYQCGVRYPPVSGARAAAAGQADFGEWPFVAVLLGPGDVYAGAGALIDNFHVLTAAHRVRDFQTSGRALKVRLGEWDASSDTEPIRSQEFLVSRIMIHPSFNPVNLKNDIALLRMSASVPLGTTPTIAPACLPPTTFTGSRCFVAGWGKNDFSNSGTYQAVQKEVDVPVRSAADCQSTLAATRLGPSFVFDSASFICAGGEAGKDACTGDGGSPLMCDLGGRFYVVGLVAWGIGCATGGVPGVYVNVQSFVSWIQATVLS